MVRLWFALFAAGVLCLPTAADDKSKSDTDDPIAAELKKARDEYRSAVEKANTAMLEAFDKETKRLEENKRLKVDVQIKQLDALKAERKAFVNTTRLPDALSMKDAVNQYKLAVAAAQLKCEKAFDPAAEKYRGKKDLTKAKAVLDAKQQFIQEVSLFDFDGVWLSTHSTGWKGRRTVQLEAVFDFDGKECKWERKGGQIIVTWPQGGWEKLDIDFKNPNVLKGITERGLGSTWVRRR